MSWVLAIILKPFFLFGFLVLVAAIEISVRKWLPDGKLKRGLLKRW